MSDFFNEVEEDLRAQQLRRLGKYAPWAAGVVGAVFLGALGFAGWKYYADTSVSEASQAYARGLKAVQAGDKALAVKSFTEAQKPLASGYKALALMQLAGLDSSPAGAKLLDDAAKAAGGDRILSDLAALQAAYRVMDTAPYADIEARLKPLGQAGRPFQAAAVEALAIAQIKAGKLQDAKGNFSALQLMGDTTGVTQSMRERAQMAVQTLNGGDRDRVLEIAKTAATLPPPAAPTMTPSAGSPVPQAGAAQQ